MYCALWGRNLIAEFDDEAPALALARELLEDGFHPEELSLELGESETPEIVHGQDLLARIRSAHQPSRRSA